MKVMTMRRQTKIKTAGNANVNPYLRKSRPAAAAVMASTKG
jgi:hypothetical protein